MNLYKVYLKKMNQLGGHTQKTYVLSPDMETVCSNYPNAAKIKEVVRDVEELEPLNIDK